MSTSQIIMLAAAVVGLTILMLSTRRKLRDHQQQTHPTARERFTELEREVKTTRNVEEVMLELDQLSRQIHGRLDTKFAKLETAIRDADQRIARLGQSPGTPAGEPPTAAPAAREKRRRQVYEMADAGNDAMAIADALQLPLGEVELILNVRNYK